MENCEVKETGSKVRRSKLHERWASQLSLANLPIGVPIDRDGWPATFGDMVDGKPVHRLDDGEEYCFQCLHCRYYDELESPMGLDWGACNNPASQYDRTVVFEHWTCKEFEWGE